MTQFTVLVDNSDASNPGWVKSSDNSIADTPANGSISYTIVDNKGVTYSGDAYKIGPGNWTTTHNLPRYKDGQELTYHIESSSLQTTGDVSSASLVDSSATVKGESGTIKLQGVVSDVDPNKINLHFIVEGKYISENDKYVQIQEYKILKANDNYQPRGDLWNDQIRIDRNNDKITKILNIVEANGQNDLNRSDRIKLKFGGTRPSPAYIKISPNAAIVSINGTSSVGNGVYRMDQDAEVILSVEKSVGDVYIQFNDTGTFSTPTKSPAKPTVRKARQYDNTDSDNTNKIVSKNLITYTDGTPVAMAGPEYTAVLKDGNWSKTWNGLPEYTESSVDGITTKIKHEYSVQEIAVKIKNAGEDDWILAEYAYEKNEDGTIKNVSITNTVPEKKSLAVTKRWLDSENKEIVPGEGNKTIKFKVYRHVDGETDQEVQWVGERTIGYDSTSSKWNEVSIDGLQTKVLVDGELKDATYYVVETLPEAGDNLTTYYQTGDGKQYSVPSDAAGATRETIVNVNSNREIKVTKEWYFKDSNGNLRQAKEPSVKTVWFKIAKADGSFLKLDTNKLPESDLEDCTVSETNDTDGTIFKITCKEKVTQVANEYGEGTHEVSSWNWNTLTFKELPKDGKYYFVETDQNGTPIKEDPTYGTSEIQYTDENGKTVSVSKPFDPSIPGNYTIKNIEKTTGLYAEKIWTGVNKDNLAGHEPVWFKLMRIKTDGNGNYVGDPEETPGVGRFALKDGEGWTKYFANLEVAPTEQTGNTYYYWQYYAVELGLLKDNASNPPKDSDYELIPNTSIKYQSKGSGTGDVNGAEERTEYKVYSSGADGISPSESAGNWLTTNRNTVQIMTWIPSYSGNGTLGIFNSTEEFFDKPITINKQWKDANGGDLSDSEKAIINAGNADDDKYSVEIQLMQRAKNLRNNKNDNNTVIPGPIDAEYGSAFTISKDEVIMQSDLFKVEPVAGSLWSFKIPNTVKTMTSDGEAEVNQLPSKGPFKYNGTTYYADFEYYVSEYRVYDASGENVTTDWNSACLTGTEYQLTLENRKTTDLTIHKKWEGVSTANKAYVDENFKGILYKVKRQVEGSERIEDVTSEIELHRAQYGLSAENVFTELVGEGTDRHYEDYIRINPDVAGSSVTWWNSDTDRTSRDRTVKITGLASLEDNYVGQNGNDWKQYKYWIEEVGYVDKDGRSHLLAAEPNAFLHGNSGVCPKYQETETSTPNVMLKDSNPYTESAKIALDATGSNHLGTVNTIKGTDIQVLKTDNAGNAKKLEGAVFELKRRQDDKGNSLETFDFDGINGTDNVVVKGTDPDKGQFTISNKDKGFTIKNLMPGVYQLREIQAPAGYVLTEEATITFRVKDDGTIVKIGENATELPTGNWFTFNSLSSTDKSYSLTVRNEPGKELPSTGGPGVRLFYILGTILILPAAAMMFRRRIIG